VSGEWEDIKPTKPEKDGRCKRKRGRVLKT